MGTYVLIYWLIMRNNFCNNFPIGTWFDLEIEHGTVFFLSCGKYLRNRCLGILGAFYSKFLCKFNRVNKHVKKREFDKKYPLIVFVLIFSWSTTWSIFVAFSNPLSLCIAYAIKVLFRKHYDVIVMVFSKKKFQLVTRFISNWFFTFFIIKSFIYREFII